MYPKKPTPPNNASQLANMARSLSYEKLSDLTHPDVGGVARLPSDHSQTTASGIKRPRSADAAKEKNSRTRLTDALTGRRDASLPYACAPEKASDWSMQPDEALSVESAQAMQGKDPVHPLSLINEADDRKPPANHAGQTDQPHELDSFELFSKPLELFKTTPLISADNLRANRANKMLNMNRTYKPNPTFYDLTEEAIKNVISHLVTKDILSLAATSKSINKITTDAGKYGSHVLDNDCIDSIVQHKIQNIDLIKEPRAIEINGPTKIQSLSDAAKYGIFSSINKLTLSLYGLDKQNCFKYIKPNSLKPLAKLEELIVDGGRIDSQSLIKLIRRNKNIDSIHLKHSNIHHKTFSDIIPNGLKKLTIKGLDRIQSTRPANNSALNVLQKCRDLRHLDLDTSIYQSDLQAITRLTNLTSLVFEYPSFPELNLSLLANLKNLTRLKITDARSVSRVSQAFPTLDNLELLDISAEISSRVVFHRDFWRDLNLRNLKALCIPADTNLTDIANNPSLKNLEALSIKEIDLSPSNLIALNSLQKINNLKSLSIPLKLNGHHPFTTTAVIDIIKRLDNLEKLVLIESDSSITAEHCKMISKMKNIKEVTIIQGPRRHPKNYESPNSQNIKWTILPSSREFDENNPPESIIMPPA